MSNFWEGDTVVAPKGGNFWDGDPVAGESPIGNNRASVVAALRGIPIAGAYVDKVTAAMNAAAQPITETGLSHAPTFGERMTENEAKVKAATDAFERENPVGTTVGKAALGTAATLPLMAAAPAAFGLTGTLAQMVGRGALSNAALSAADAGVRGENPLTAAAVGGTVGAVAPLAARGVGALARGIKDYRNPPPIVPQNVERVAGVDVPLTTGQATLDPRIQSEEEVMRKGGRGTSAEDIARQADQQAQQAVGEASANISKMMDPTGASASTAPQAAAGAIQTELAAKEQARQAAAQAEALRVQTEGESLARGLGAPPATPVSAPINWDRKTVANGLPLFKQQEVIDVPVDAMESAFKAGNPNMYVEKPSAAIIDHANAGKPVSIPEVSATHGNLVFTNGRNRFALAKQNGEKTIPVAVDASNRADVEALLQKHAQPTDLPSPLGAAESTGAAVVSKAAAAKGATRSAYKEAYSEPGALDASVPQNMAEDLRARINQGDDGLWVDPDSTSIANSALKELDKTIGKGIFRNFAIPEAGAGTQEAAGRAKKLADDMVVQGIHPDRAKAAAAASEGLSPEAMDQAAGTAAHPIDLKTMDSARKRLIVKYKDAKDKSYNTGDASDLRAMGKILHEFDSIITDAFDSGKFSGDSTKAKELLAAARRSHAEYKETFSNRGGDPIGRNIEKILGRYSDTKAVPEEIQKMAYGSPNAPGGGDQQRLALRLKKIFGPNSPEYGRYKQGLFKYVLGDESLSPAEKAARIDKFAPGGLAGAALEPAERRALAAHSASLKGIQPAAKPTDRVGKALARITGADGHPPATSNEVVDKLFSKGAKGDGLSTELAVYLKRNLSPASWSALKQGAFEHLVSTAEGAKDLTSNGIAKRLSAYLDGDLSKVLNTPEELAEMRKLMLVHNKLTPLPGTTNPSGSAFFGQKMLKSAGKNLMTMLGFAHGGIGGAVVGHGLDSIGGMVKDARAGKKATQLFFGKQAKSPIVQSRIPQLLAPTVSQRAQGGAQ